MATKKDLVEAYSFSRRRLVTAFVSGAPGGREVEPSRPGRTIVGGVALSILLIAGAAIGGVFNPKVDVDFSSPQFILPKDAGGMYVVVDQGQSGGDPQLRPVINVVSAQLILGHKAVTEDATTVPLDVLDGEDKGPEIGILGAPSTVPTSSSLVPDGWSACTGSGMGVKVDVSETPDVTPTPSVGFVVKSDDKNWLIGTSNEGGLAQRAYRYALPKDNGLLYQRLSGSAEAAVTVPQNWLALFDQGSGIDLSSFGLTNVGGTPSNSTLASQIGRQGKVGDFYEDGGTTFVVGDRFAFALTPFAAQVYRTLTENQKSKKRARLITPPQGVTEIQNATFADEAHWPQDPLSAQQDGEVCAQLLAPVDGVPTVGLAQQPQDDASAEGIDPADESGDIGVERSVDSGKGAVFASGGFTGNFGSSYLLDDTGTSYRLGPGATELLGYDEDDLTVVPESWNKLFKEGVFLSQDAALCPPRDSSLETGSTTCS